MNVRSQAQIQPIDHCFELTLKKLGAQLAAGIKVIFFYCVTDCGFVNVNVDNLKKVYLDNKLDKTFNKKILICDHFINCYYNNFCNAEFL